MKSVRNIFSGLFIFGGFIALFTLLHAQETATLTQSETGSMAATTDASALSDVEVEVKAIEMTTPLPASAVSYTGNFYSTQHLPGTADEWPPLPADTLNLPVWPLGDDFYLLADENVDYAALQTQSLSANGGMRAMTDFAPLDLVSSALVAGTNLWLAITNLANGTAGLRLSNTLADVEYEIQVATNLTQPQWVSIGTVLGSEITNWTAASVAAAGDPALFLRVRSDLDSDDIGIPDWWQLEYFGYVGIDPNGDPAGDGWSNAQKYEYGMNPKVFDTPPAPQLTVFFNAGTGVAVADWTPTPSPVTGYTLHREYYPATGSAQIQDFNFLAGTNQFQDSAVFDSAADELEDDPTIYASYKIQAHYPNGDSAWSPTVWVESSQLNIALIAGPNGSAYLVLPQIPAGTSAIRIIQMDERALSLGDTSLNQSFDIPINNFTNGLYPIPASLLSPAADVYGLVQYDWWAVSLGTNIAAEAFLSRGFYSEDGDEEWMVLPDFDGRTQLKQNLGFLFRAATTDSPFEWSEIGSDYSVSTHANPSTYEYAGFYSSDSFNNYAVNGSIILDGFGPFYENYLYRNFVFDAAKLDGNGRLTTGVGGDYGASSPSGLTLQDPPTYSFDLPSGATNVASLLSGNVTQWLATYAFDSGPGYLGKIGITDSSGTFSMANNAVNYWGLRLQSATIGYGPGSGAATTLLNAGGNTTQGGYFYPSTVQPQFQTAGYDFWQMHYSFRYVYPFYGYLPALLPGMPGFNGGSSNQPLIAAVGDPTFAVASYAKLAVTNGYPGVYGYLGQYFDQAYQITNGVATTNTTGVLSPYGSFFATQPGPTALVTMPDPDTGARGTATVYAVSAVIDRTQGSNMDLSFDGADATSVNNPAVIWANNNMDRWDYDLLGSTYEQDDVNNASAPDCQYTTNGLPAIPCPRDLEDYFRLWTPGVAALMKVLPANYTVQLTLTGSGQIRIFQAIEPDGGTNYLFDETTASNQVANSASLYVGLLTSSSPIIFNNQTNFDEHFIFCGAAVGSAQIDLQVLDGSLNVIADAPVFLQINDIKNMYERWTVGDEANVTPTATATLAVNDMPSPPQSPFQYTAPQDTNTPYILHVHGYNMQSWEKDRYAETEFKRLYWQGYHGRFGEFRWPTTIQGFFNLFSAFDNSESNAWASAKGLTNLLTKLNAEYPGNVFLTAHSHGNVVAGEALRLAGNNQLVNTYIAMQGALASHAYDPTTPYQISPTYPDYYAQYPANGNVSYFNGVKGAGTYVNFFNTNDWALTGPWPVNQAGKPVGGYSWLVSDGQTNFYSGSNPFYTLLLLPADRYTIFSYCDPATCYALGAQADVGGAFLTGTNHNEVNLPSVWPPDPGNYTDHIWHSAEFRSDNPQRWQFWNEVLVKMKLKSQ